MHLRGARWWGPVVAMIFAACGSRSGLREDAASSGGGGGGTSTSTTTMSSVTTTPVMTGGGGSGAGGAGTGGAGAGGGSDECGALAIVGPPAGIDGGGGFHQFEPRLTLSSDDGARVTVVSAWLPVVAPGDAPTALRHASFEPWSIFPAGQNVSPAAVASANGGGAFAAARAAGDHFALLLRDPSAGSLRFSPAFVPGSGSPPATTLADGQGQQAFFAVQGAGGHLLGTGLFGPTVAGEVYQIRASLADAIGTVAAPTHLGCALSPMLADAVAVADDRWIMSLSSGTTFADPGCFDDGSVDWPDEVQVVMATPAGFTQTDVIGAPAGALDLKMAARSDGAWVIIGTVPGQVPTAMFRGLRINLEGHVLSDFPVSSADPGQEQPVSGTLVAAGVMDRLAVAWIDVAGDKGPFIRVRVFGANDEPQGHAEVFPAGPLVGAPALLGSPLTNQLLLAWTEQEQPGGPGQRVRMVRLDCVVPP